MIILKKINNNFALALDDAGEEVVARGLGIGFGKTPRNLEDESKIDRIYRSPDAGFISSLAKIPQEILDISSEIAQRADSRLSHELNPNLIVTLADHIQFAVERVCKGVDFATPLDVDISLVYPLEYELGCESLALVKERSGVSLPDFEASLIALHLVSAQSEGANQHAAMDHAMRTMRIIDHIRRLIEDTFAMELNVKTYNYRRFVSHVRYLLGRCEKRSANHDTQLIDAGLLAPFISSLETCHVCAQKICAYLEEEYNTQLGNDELLYLMLYINRLVQ